MRFGHEPGAGVKRRRTRVAHERDILPPAQCVEERGGRALLVVLVQGDGARLNAVAGEQRARGARVLAGDEVRARSVSSARGLASARLPIGVATTYRTPGVNRASSSPLSVP